jgi:hypothetical protein
VGEGNFGFWNKFPGITEMADLSFMVADESFLGAQAEGSTINRFKFRPEPSPNRQPGPSNGDARQRIPDFSSSPI